MRIAVTGPESSGKSYLVEKIGKEFDLAPVPEYAREYLGSLDRPYALSDLIEIAEGQLALEAKLGEGRKGVVADTDLTVIKIWAEDKFKNVPLILELAWEAQQYDHYLLCKPDIPWEADPLRENPKDRDRLFGMYENYLKAKGLPFTIVHGSEEGRWSIVEEVIKTIP